LDISKSNPTVYISQFTLENVLVSYNRRKSSYVEIMWLILR